MRRKDQFKLVQVADIANPQIWQIAAGETGRFYDNLFLDHDIMFLGPGRYGEFPYTYQEHLKAGEISQSEYDRIADFSNKIRGRDVVLLRKGNYVRAIGIVVSGYQYFDDLDDIYGWDLQHIRRVCWQPQLQDTLNSLQQTKGLFNPKRGRTISLVHEKCLLSSIEPLVKQCQLRYENELQPLPAAPSKPLSWDEVKLELYDRGLRYDLAEKTANTMQQIARLADWYHEKCRYLPRPTEHEVVAHMVIPLLIALGWSEQQLAVEWQRIDLAAFWGSPTDADHCVLVCEAKGRDQGLQNVIEQADRYVKKLSLKECNRILVTDGTCFYLYNRESDIPVGYFNINRLRTNHVAPAGTNAIDTIIALTPAGITRPIPINNNPLVPMTQSIPMMKRMELGL